MAAVPLAAIGTSFTYQGRLTDSGSSANGSYDFRFILYNLYNAESGGSQVGSTINVEDYPVTDGLLTVQLDFGNVFDGTALWLEIGVRPGSSSGTYTTLSPRQALTAAPYSLYALAAPWSGLSGVPAGFADNVDDDTTYSVGNQLESVGTIFNVLEGTGSNLDADLLDGNEGAFYQNASNLNDGTLSTHRYSAYSDLTIEGYLDADAGTDLLARFQADGRLVNEGQGDSVTSAMIVNGVVAAGDMQDGAALAEILDNDGPGSTLDADTVDGLHSGNLARTSYGTLYPPGSVTIEIPHWTPSRFIWPAAGPTLAE